MASSSSSSVLRVFPMRLTPGADLTTSLLDAARTLKLEAPFVLTCCGSVSKATLRFADKKDGRGQQDVKTFDEHFEICSLVGTLSPSSDAFHLHATLGRQDGSVVAGHVVKDFLVHTTAEIILSDCEGRRFSRVFDPETGYRELQIE